MKFHCCLNLMIHVNILYCWWYHILGALYLFNAKSSILKDFIFLYLGHLGSVKIHYYTSHVVFFAKLTDIKMFISRGLHQQRLRCSMKTNIQMQMIQIRVKNLCFEYFPGKFQSLELAGQGLRPSKSGGKGLLWSPFCRPVRSNGMYACHNIAKCTSFAMIG